MSKRITTYLLTIAAVALVVAAGAGAAIASSRAPAPKKTSVVPIVMADPGCHWFRVAGKNTTKLTVSGTTGFRNFDEAALIFKGQGSVERLPVGKTLTIGKPGTYHITMVGQAPDDNHLLLVVR